MFNSDLNFTVLDGLTHITYKYYLFMRYGILLKAKPLTEPEWKCCHLDPQEQI